MQKAELRARIERISHTILNAANAVLDDIDSRLAPTRRTSKRPLTPIEAAPWRWTCDAFALWRQCAKPICKRARRCKGDARACLIRHAPQLPAAPRQRVLASMRERFSAAPSTSPPPSAARRRRPPPVSAASDPR